MNDADRDSLPGELKTLAQQRFESIIQSINSSGLDFTFTGEEFKQVVKVITCSDFMYQFCLRQPQNLVQLLQSNKLTSTYPSNPVFSEFETLVESITQESELAQAFRQFRRQEHFRIAWRDINGLASVHETMLDVSNIALRCIQLGLKKLDQWLQQEWGQPTDENNSPQSLIVLAMGKLGASELNFSSDIDLIFLYDQPGQTQGQSKSTTNEHYFTQLGQRFIKLLNELTSDGFVYRVDMRLRPFGDSGPLVINFETFENYLQVHGREWERYAMIKACAITGEQHSIQELNGIIKSFVFRRYLDFNVFESLRDMKQLIVREIEKKSIKDNVKLGAGGIREIEFIGQAFQLLRGGREKSLQSRQILVILHTLSALDILPTYVVDELTTAYLFLRQTENKIQEFADRQEHRLPIPDEQRSQLAYVMGYSNWQDFYSSLKKHMDRVHGHFSQIFDIPQSQFDDKKSDSYTTLWLQQLSTENAVNVLEQAGYEDPAQSFEILQKLHSSFNYRALSNRGRQRFDRFLPLLLGAVSVSKNPSETLVRILRVIESIARRTAYLALLEENPLALSQLVKLSAASLWINDYLSRNPILLDELLDPRFLYSPPKRNELEQEIQFRLGNADTSDLEIHMEVLRQFKLTNVLRVAAADILEALPLMIVSDHLTWIAEIILHHVLKVSWQHMTERHGYPECSVNQKPCEMGFAIIAYGKLGGIELGYGSDLDLVFLHAGGLDQNPTNGKKPIDNSIFFTRLGQRILHLLSTHTHSGVLYDIDMRLRPSGASGMLVSNWETFEKYQYDKAWTWEHQALVRARPITGDALIIQRFNTIRTQVLCQKRDIDTLKREVIDMRNRMMDAAPSIKNGEFHIKLSRGGITDIEFIVQYAVLAWSHKNPDLVKYSDNIRQIETLANLGLFSSSQARILMDAYRTYRTKLHKLVLLGKPGIVDIGVVADYEEKIKAIWNQTFGEKN